MAVYREGGVVVIIINNPNNINLNINVENIGVKGISGIGGRTGLDKKQNYMVYKD